ncbi:MAG TPA: FAD-binding oxidoreductase [Acetobacteraceae bacterium]|nr:FAD-binding oxidoreductase [Acetobacteraceae bacterium]
MDIPARPRFLIIGGGIMGSVTAYELACAGHAGDTIVIEPDPTYEFAATPRAVGGIRLQHAIPENVEMSLYGDTVYSDIGKAVTGGAVQFDPQFRRIGYLYCVEGAEDLKALEACVATQRGFGVRVDIFSAEELRARWPAYTFAGVDAGAYSPDDGQIDPYAALMHYRRAAEGRGVRYVKDRVTGLEHAGGRVTAAVLESGARLAPEMVVCVANCWAPPLCAMVGMPVPVVPKPRQQFRFTTEKPFPAFPAMRFANGRSVRPHQDSLIAGWMRPDQEAGFFWDLDHQVFDDVLWPWLAEQAPAFEAIKQRGGWLGHYDVNLLDGNMILDVAPHLSNYFIAVGFTGHGLQHAPAVGRALRELMLTGRFQTIDLSRMGYRRVMENAPLEDHGPKA